MADISKITLPNGNTYDIKDATARSAINSLLGGDAVTFGGVTSTALTEGGTEKPTVDSAQVTPTKGQLYFYGTKEYLWDGAKWIELGVVDALGDLAYKDSVTVKYDKATVNTKTFTGTGVRLVTGQIPVPKTYTTTFTGKAKTVSVSGTPEGTVSQPTFTGTGVRLVTGNIAVPTSASFTGTEATISVTGTATGTVSQPTFSGTKASGLTVSPATSGTATYTPEGTVTAPTISVATAGSTTTIKNPTSVTVAKTVVAAAPGATAPSNSLTYYSVADETLSLYQLGYTTGASITTNNVTVKNGDAAYSATAPTFTGTGNRLILQDYTPAGTVSQPSFSSGAISGSATYTPAGTIGLTTTNKTATVSAAASGDATYTPGGTVSQPTFTGTALTSTGSYTPEAQTISTVTATTEDKATTVSKAASGTTTYTPEGTINVTLTQTNTNATVSYA